MNPENQEVLTESLQGKSPEDRYFSVNSVGYILYNNTIDGYLVADYKGNDPIRFYAGEEGGVARFTDNLSEAQQFNEYGEALDKSKELTDTVGGAWGDYITSDIIAEWETAATEKSNKKGLEASISLVDLDNSHIIEKVIPEDKIDEVENLILKSDDPEFDNIREARDEVEYLLRDLDDEIPEGHVPTHLYGNSLWVWSQIKFFLEKLQHHIPKSAAEYQAGLEAPVDVND